MTLARLAADSGLTRIELAALYGVSRQTIHTWLTGPPPRAGSFTARMAEVITKGLVAALDRRILPLGSMSREARGLRIAKMAVTLQSLKLAPIK